MLTRLFLLLLLTAFCAFPLAQTSDPVPSPPTTADPSQDSAEEEAGEEEEEEERFLPTEKINVDSSVSFPVDI